MAQPALSRPTGDRQASLTEITGTENPGRNEAHSAGVSWAAVVGGAFAAAALSLILISLGTGFGFSVVSPWSNAGRTLAKVGAGAVLWLILTQVIASAMGGYLAGRLRTKWVAVHTDEVYFRDTAHGFLVWAVGLVVTASLLASAAASLAGEPRADADLFSPHAYYVDALLRSNGLAADRNDSLLRAEASRIFAHALRQGDISQSDKTYLGQVVSARTGLDQSAAEKRVSDVFAEYQQSTDNARKAIGHLSLWIFVALLSGAFCASYAATIGGRQRDHVASIAA